MPRKTYRMTATAEAHFKNAVRDTHQKWGIEHARKYSAALLAGFQYIADNHHTFSSAHRAKLSEGTPFQVHLIAHRYVAFQDFGPDTIVITALFHERMDIPNRLRELQALARRDIDALKSRDVEPEG